MYKLNHKTMQVENIHNMDSISQRFFGGFSCHICSILWGQGAKFVLTIVDQVNFLHTYIIL